MQCIKSILLIFYSCARTLNINQDKSVGQWVNIRLEAGSLVTGKCLKCHLTSRGRWQLGEAPVAGAGKLLSQAPNYALAQWLGLNRRQTSNWHKADMLNDIDIGLRWSLANDDSFGCRVALAVALLLLQCCCFVAALLLRTTTTTALSHIFCRYLWPRFKSSNAANLGGRRRARFNQGPGQVD